MKHLAAFVAVVSIAGGSAPGVAIGAGWTQPTSKVPEGLVSIDQAIEEGRYKDAEEEARRRLAAIEAQHGVESLQAADVRDRLLAAFWRQQKPSPAMRALSERAVEIRERISPATWELALALINHGNVLEVEARYADAQPFYERAVEVAEKALGPDDRRLATALTNLGVFFRSIGDFPRSKALLERTVRIVEHAFGANHLEVGKALHNLAAALWEAGEYEQAHAAFRRAADTIERALGTGHTFFAAVQEGLAVSSQALGDYAAAISGHRRALEIRERLFGPNDPQVGSSLANLGEVLATVGDLKNAREHLQRAATVFESTYGPEHPLLTVALTNLAYVQQRIGEPAAARAALERAVAIHEKTLGADHAALSIPVMELANVLADAGTLEEAWPLYERARRIAERTRGADHPAVAAVLQEEGIRRLRFKDADRARRLLERALAIRITALGGDHPSTAESRHALAELRASTGDLHGAFALALRAEAAAREHFRRTARWLPQRQALLYAQARTRSQALALSVASRLRWTRGDDVAALWDAVIRSRALVLDEMASRRRAGQERSGGLDAAQLQATTSQLARALLRGADDDPAVYRAEIDGLQDRLETLERQLAASSARFRETRQRENAGLREVLDALPAGAVLIGFAEYEHRPRGSARVDGAKQLVAFAGRRRGSVQLVSLGSTGRIERLVTEWRRRVTSEASAPAFGAAARERSYRQAGIALRRTLWDPLGPIVAGATRVFIVPDGSVNLLDFSVLPTGASSYLVETGPALQYLTAERDLMPRRSAKRTAGLLAFGDPRFSERPRAPAASGATFRSSCLEGLADLPPLPGSATEVETIDRLFRTLTGETSRVLTGSTAVEEEAKAAGGWRMIHFATHGLSIGSRCGTAPGEALDAEFTNPLVRSGLAFTGAATRSGRDEAHDDGILTAEEIASLDLSGVEWVVLSACDTGLGEIRPGEGVFGLRRAFQIAGAGTIVMSLWQVDDALSRDWMAELYRARLAGGVNTPEAVRAAALHALRARRAAGRSAHPFYWAGFVAAGEWR